MQKFFPEFEGQFKALLESVKGRKIAVAGHMRPDGDCVSSQFALAHILREAGAAQVVCVNQNALPHTYANFAGGEELLDASEFCDGQFEIVTVDCADYLRAGENLAKRFPNPLACIDHHVTNKTYARINILDSRAAATAEIIAGLALDAFGKVSKEDADRLYMGIAMDTRQFTTSSTRTRTFEISAKLAANGADTAWVAVQLYQRESFAKMKLLAAYLKTLTMHIGGRVCMGTLPTGIYELTGAQKADSDGLVDYARSIDGVEVGILLEQMPHGVKGSLRGKTPDYRVDEVAAMFGGGGHLAAAGFTAEGEKLETFAPKLIEIFERRLSGDRPKH